MSLGATERPLLLESVFLSDQSQSLDFEQVRALPESAFAPLNQKAIGFGFSASAYWFKTPLSNPAQDPQNRLLSFQPTWLDQIDLWLIDPEGTVTHLNGGDTLAFDQRAIKHPQNLFEIALPPGESQLISRLETRDPFVVFMALDTIEGFYSRDSHYRLFQGLIYGALGVMLLYNLFLCRATGDRIYGFYALYVGSFITMNLTYSGFSFAHLLSAWPECSNWAHSVLIYLFGFSGVLFAIFFLDTRNRLPRLHRFLVGYLIFVLAAFGVTALLGYASHVTSSILLVVSYTVITFAAGVIAWWHGNVAARFFILATTAGLAGAAITAFTVMGLLPYSFLTFRAADIGMVFDALLLSIALADRYRLLRAESEELRIKDARQQEIILRQHQQATLGSLISAIAHQMKQPLTAISLEIQDLAEQTRQEGLSQKSIDGAERGILDSVQFMSKTIDQFRNYFRPDQAAARLELSQLLNQTRSLLTSRLTHHRIKVEISCPESLYLRSHANALQQVLLNLLSNAIDALLERRTADPLIRISVTQQPETIVIQICDNAGGLSDAALKRLFEIFFTTKGDQGTGIGLHLCRTLLSETLQGSISGYNGELGACFEVTLPHKPE